MSNIEYMIEVRGVYDGWSIVVINWPEYAYVNRWAKMDDPLTPEPGYEERYRLTEEYIERSGVPRRSLKEVQW